ncbi:protein D2-like [Apostichopus japonicus]|uniref:protein D2-like n=1 Tax=Stichopus japonicus TaxID=307972 RepID=UPI003AB43E5F
MLPFYPKRISIWLVILSVTIITAITCELEDSSIQCPDPSTSGNDVDGLLFVSYESVMDVVCGMAYNLEELNNHPEAPEVVQYAAAETDGYYTLIMVDPDAPSRTNPTLRYILHWLITNLKGSDLQTGQHNTGDVIAPYHGPAPPLGSGPHRYYLLLFQQDGPLTDITPPSSTSNFDWIEFAKSYDLGMPVAFNMFTTENIL